MFYAAILTQLAFISCEFIMVGDLKKRTLFELQANVVRMESVTQCIAC